MLAPILLPISLPSSQIEIQVPKPPDFNAEIVVPLRQKQAERAAEAAAQVAAENARIAAEAAQKAEEEHKRVEAENAARVANMGLHVGPNANSYDFGNCTFFVASWRPVPNNWGNARSWYGNALAAGWAVGRTPAINAIAQTTAGWWGHVAIVVAVKGDQVLLSEMNVNGFNTIDQRWDWAGNYNYIY